MNQNQAEKQYKDLLQKIKEGKRVSPLKVIRMRCLDCCAYQQNEVKLCPADDCIAWAFRFGRNPIKRVMSEKQKAVLEKMSRKHPHM